MINFDSEQSVRFNARYLDLDQARAPALEPPRSLAQAVESFVRSVDATLIKPVAPAHAGPAFQGTALLGLLTFCYARQVYSSLAIAEQLQRDFTLFKVEGYGLPDAQLLQEFRLLNRGPLELCLRSALFFLAEEKIRQGIVTHVKEEHIKDEAGRRIITAMFTDSQESRPVSRSEVSYTPRSRMWRANGSMR